MSQNRTLHKYKVPQILSTSFLNSVELFQNLVCQHSHHIQQVNFHTIQQIKARIQEQNIVLQEIAQKMRYVEVCDSLLEKNIKQLKSNANEISRFVKYYFSKMAKLSE
ncbi:Hypothetical_protein [Hexamita inflata]|uniref:Hypothetical_protein n=1 Tax=Hexamita inflata TaxID=28002 RepID=A0AA86UIK1_9EUKA|nr:Hypothetical protein HINF_LOCUS40247 [Hexamita inflata]